MYSQRRKTGMVVNGVSSMKVSFSACQQEKAHTSAENQVEESQELQVLSPDTLIKHPLQNKWTLWFMRNNRNKNWEESQCEITSFDTVEDFWALYNHIEVASRLPAGCDYSLFKYGIKPMWEDEGNQNGGRWLINLNKTQRNTDLDVYWLETILCLIGEAFDEQSDDICGAVVNIRQKGDKIGIWTSNYRNEDSNKKIGRKIKERLNMSDRTNLGYQAHEDTMTKSSSTAKHRFMV